MKTILCTGMSGSGRRARLNEIARMSTPPNCELLLRDVGDIMFELERMSRSRLPNDHARGIWEDAVLKRGISLDYKRSAAHQRILSEVARTQEQEDRMNTWSKVMIVSTHAVFHYSHSRLKGFETHWLTDLNPDFFVTITDDILRVRRRLRASQQQRWTDITVGRLLDWREEEFLITQITADILGKAHILVPNRRSRKILYDLIFFPEKVPIYLSYPMTFVQHRPEIREQVQRLEEELSRWFVVFDPFDVRDLEHEEELLEDIRQEYAVTGKELSSHESEQIRCHLRSQTIVRDHTLIDQCCGVVVYYPVLRFKGRDIEGDVKVEEVPPFSSGVLDEIFYATQCGKKIYLIWAAKHPPGPFLENACDVRVGSPEELVSVLRSQVQSISRTR